MSKEAYATSIFHVLASALAAILILSLPWSVMVVAAGYSYGLLLAYLMKPKQPSVTLSDPCDPDSK